MKQHRTFTKKQKKLLSGGAVAIFILLSAALAWFVGRPTNHASAADSRIKMATAPPDSSFFCFLVNVRCCFMEQMPLSFFRMICSSYHKNRGNI